MLVSHIILFTLKHFLLKILSQVSSKRYCFSFNSLFCALGGQPAVNTDSSQQTTGFAKKDETPDLIRDRSDKHGWAQSKQCDFW